MTNIVKNTNSSSENNYSLGQLAMQTGQIRSGLIHFKRALNIDPTQQRYWTAYIDALIQNNQLDIAIQVLSIGRQGGLAGETIEQLEIEIMDKTLTTLLNEKRYTDMEVRAKEMTMQHPKYANGWKALGNALLHQGKPQEALAPLHNALNLLPTDIDLLNSAGHAYLNCNQLENAEIYFQKALNITHNNYNAYYGLGQVFRKRGNFYASEQHFKQGLTIAPDTISIYIALLDLYLEDKLEVGNHSNFKECLLRALMLGADNSTLEPYFKRIVEISTLCELNAFVHQANSLLMALTKEKKALLSDQSIYLDLPSDELCSLEGINIKIYRSNNSSFSVVIADECLIHTDHLYPVFHEKYTCYDLFGFVSKSKCIYTTPLTAEREIENCFILGHFKNYYHFIIDHLARLPGIIVTNQREPKIYLRDNTPKPFIAAIEQALRFLSVNTATFIYNSDQTIRARNCFLPCIPSPKTKSSFLQEFGKWIQNATSSTQAAPHLIYFSRKNALWRRLLNEDELVARLKQEFDFVAIDAGDLSVCEQINFVRNARVIVGPHGAALTNFVFAPNLTELIELYTEQLQPHFEIFSSCRGVNYTTVKGKSIGCNGHVRADNRDFIINIDELMVQVRGALERIHCKQ